MACRTDTLPHFLTDVADAIREKTGSSDTIQASTFDTAISNIPSGGSYPVVPQTLSFDEANNYYNSILPDLNDYIADIDEGFDAWVENNYNSYPTYTSDEVTLYTPDASCNKYVIHKRNNQYRVVWFKPASLYTNALSYSNNSLTSKAIVKTIYYDAPTIHNNYLVIRDGERKLYYSNYLNTIQDCIQEMQKSSGSSLTYTPWTGNSVGSDIDTPYLVPYSNFEYIMDATNTVVISQRISSNETISVIS